MNKVLFALISLSINVVAQKSIMQLATDSNIQLRVSSNSTEMELLEKLAFQSLYGTKPSHISYSSLKENIDSTKIKNWVSVASKAKFIEPMYAFIEPDFSEYTASKTYKFHPNYSRLSEFQNFFRWINRFNLENFILINVASGQLTYYKGNHPLLDMKVIVGTSKNKTPRMASTVDAVMLYPYWVPTRNIAVNEILPMVKKDLTYLDRNNFDVLDSWGGIVDPRGIDWISMNSENFSYKFRQGTGCDNALGLLKINLKNPFSIYMHDVPHTKQSLSLFDKEKRFFSHGCIRLEKPLLLANLLHPKEVINENLLSECLLNEKPKLVELEKEVPVFVMYFTDYIDKNGEWKTADDFYKLSKND